MLTIKGLIERTEVLYDILGDAGLTRAALEELAKYRQANVPFGKLSADLKRSLLTIVRAYEDKTGEMDMRQALATPEGSTESPPEEDKGPAPTPSPAEEELPPGPEETPAHESA